MKVGSSRRAYQESAAALYPDAASGRDYTSIVNPRHYARLQGLIADPRARPLALYYFGSGGTDQRKVLTGTTSGNVMLNGTIMHVAQDDLPFGGVGASGIGPITASKASSVSATPRVSMRRAGGTSSNYFARHSGR